MLDAFAPADWYWIVAGNAAQVFSSARAAYVPLGDQQYAAWARDNAPARIASEAELWDLLSAMHPAGLPAIAAAQEAHKTRQISVADAALLKIAFNHENRIRALEAKAPITQAQFVAAVKALL